MAVFLYGLFWSFAGSLTPPAGTPSPTMNSLGDIYNILSGSEYSSGSFVANENGNINEQLKYIIENLGYTFGDSNPDFVLTTADGAGNALGDTNPAQVLTTASAAGTYNATNLTPANVAQGVSFGVGQVGTLEEGYAYGDSDPQYVAGTADGGGTLLVNMFNGSGYGYIGGNQDNGGVDDDALNLSPGYYYSTNWTPCNVGNNWCSLGVNGENVARVMDNATGLVWSYPCSGTNCSNMTNATADTYNHATALTNCASGAHGKTGWRLPHQKQLLQAYINGSAVSMETDMSFWSSTASIHNIGVKWVVNLGMGASSATSSATRTICVQLAP